MSQSQGPGGGALEPHPYGGGFGPPPSSGKDPYSPPSTTNGNGLTELGSSDSSHLTLLKSSNGLPGFTSFGDSEGLGSRLSDAFSEMRYVELQNWDLSSYSSESLSARLIDSRSIESPDQIIQYRPWEKPDSNQSHSPTLTSSGNNINGGGSNNTVTTSNSGNHNGNGTNTDKSPTTLTPLTNAFPTFSDAFNGHKLPSFQSQFNAFQDQPIGHPLGHHHLGDPTGGAALPSFHTLPANRGYVHPPPHGHLHGHPVPHGHPSPHGHPHHGHPVLVTTPVQAREIPNIQQQFLDERHIQLFPGQLAAGQFGQLIATTTAQPMAVTNGHHHLNSPHHHFVMTNGSNHGGNFSVTGIPTSSSSTLQLQELVPVPPMQLLHPAAAATNNSSTISTTTSSKLPQTTDGSIPGLNLNLIDPHLNANNHLNLNLNVPKYLSSSDGPIEAHLIAVKIPPNSFEHSGIHHAHQMPPHHNSGAHHHHSITKLEQSQQQNSPQIVSNSHNSTNNSSSINNHHHHNNNNTPATKRQQKRKRNSIDSGENHQNHTMSHHHQPPTTQHQQINTHHNHNHQDLNDPQVSSVSSSDSDFKRPNLGHNGTTNGNGTGLMSDGVDPGLEKPVKKKRKRCGECIGCQKKDNCGDCAPCRNDKSHQICKVRRCEKLTEKKPNARGEKMDGRGRQGSNNSGAAASAASSMMSPYGYPNSQPTTASDNSSSFSPRERFWSTPGSASTPEPWGGQSYTPQLGVNELPTFSPNQPSPGSQHSFNLGNNLNIPSHSSYPPPPPPQTNGGGNSLPDLGFSGPSPPNPIQPISVSSSPYPPPPSSISPRRQYTPSTTPSPHITHQSPSNSNNSNVNGINGNGINGNSNHSSSSTNESPPMQNPNNNNNNNSSSNNSASSTFESYLNGEGQSGGGNNNNNTNGMNGNSSVNTNGQVPNGLENGHGVVVGKSGANDPTGHPNELPGYLPHPRQSLHNSSRYPGEIKASDGEMMHQYPHHPQHQQQNPYYQHHQSQNYGNYASSNSNYPPYPPGNNMDTGFHTPQQSNIRRPFDPYQPYQNPNSESGYGDNFGPQQHDHHHHFRPSASTPSSGPGSVLGRESGKVEELLENGNGQRKIDPCESLQILPGKTTGNSGSGPRPGSGSSSRPFDDGSAVNFEATLMNLNSSHHSHHSLAHHQHSQQTQSHQQDSSSCSSQSPSSYDLHFGAVPPPLSHEMQQHMQQPGSQSSESSSTGPPPPLGPKINHSVSKTEESNNNNNRKNSNNSDTIVAKGKTKNNNNNNSKKNKNNNSTFSFNDEMDFENLESNNKQTETFLASGHPQSPTKLGNTNPLTAAKGNSPESQRRKKFGSSNISTSSSISDTVMNVSTSISSSANNPNSEGGDRVSPLISSGSGSVTNSTNSNNPNSQQKPNAGPGKKKKAKKNKQTGNGNGNNNNNSTNKFSDENSSVKDQKCGLKGNENSKFNNIRVKEEPKERDFDKNQTVNFRLGGNANNNVKMKVEDDDGPMMHHGSLIDSDTEDGADDKEKKDVPMVECGCFPADEVHAEPGPFYTHLGAAHTLMEMRESIETRTGFRGQQIRFEKVIYTGKEGKTSQGCPLAKWIIRRGSYEEQLLFLVKHRKGHKCSTAWIVVCCVIWEGVPPHFADNLYDTMVYKLNRFGIPTTRRSDTNEQRSCACQGVDPDTCGAAYSFGCAWSMFFNGCKYARSRNVRKFRLTEEHEESELEEKVQHLATHLAPLYERVAPESYRNQVEHENEGLECRLGYRPGRPFSGVTACLDYASHAHKDAHNMINGCTVTVSFTRNRTLGKGDDEQYHVFPLYKLDDTDEHGSKDGQKQKVKKGQLEILKKFPCKVRVRKVPLLPSRRRGKAKPPSSSSSSTNSGGSGGGGGGGGSNGGSAGGTGGSGGGGGLTPSASANSPGSSSIKSPDYSDMPPLKREKVSLFDDHLTNGTASGGSMGSSGTEQSSLFDSRFHPAYSHHPHHPFSNLLMPNNQINNAHSPVKLGMSLEEVQSSQISSTVLDSECATSSVAAAAAAASLWNHFGHGASGGVGSHHGSPSAGSSGQSHGHLTPPSAAATSPFRSYFDHPFSSSSAASSQSGGHSGSSVTSPFGHSSSLTDLSSNTLSSSRHSSSSNPNLSSCNPSGGIPIGGGGGLLGGGANHIITIGGVPSGGSNNNLSPNPSSGNVTPGYSSMSPILPSFRHTFMTEAESMSMISSMSSPPSGGSPPDSTSSPRSAPPPHHHHPHSHNHHSSSSSSSHHHHHAHHGHHHHKSNSSTPGSNHSSSSSAPAAAGSAASLAASRESSGLGPFATSSSLGEAPYFHPGQSNYAGSASSGAPPPSGGLYHPHPHNPCLPSMSMSSSQVGGVPFSTSSMLSSNSMSSMSSPYGGGMGPSGSSVSSFGPPAPPEHHFGMNMNSMNPLNPWNAPTPSGYSSNYSAAAAAAAYGSSAVYHPHAHPQASSLNMNMGSMSGMGMSSMSTPNFGHPAMNVNMNINQYSPYQNTIQQQIQQQQQLQNIQSQMTNSWAPPPLPFAPNMNMNMHPHPHAPPPPSCFVAPPKPKVIPEVNESFSDNEDAFKDTHLGGVAIALTHGAVVLQCAKHEMHATTALKTPNRLYPSRICLVFYQHKSMNNRFHGWSEWEKKIEAKKLQEVKLINQGKMEASPRKMKQLIKEGYLTDNP